MSGCGGYSPVQLSCKKSFSKPAAACISSSAWGCGVAEILACAGGTFPCQQPEVARQRTATTPCRERLEQPRNCMSRLVNVTICPPGNHHCTFTRVAAIQRRYRTGVLLTKIVRRSSLLVRKGEADSFHDRSSFPPHAQYRLTYPVECQAVNESRRWHEKPVPKKNLFQARLGFPQQNPISQTCH